MSGQSVEESWRHEEKHSPSHRGKKAGHENTGFMAHQAFAG
jgi:hypothetical protein